MPFDLSTAKPANSGFALSTAKPINEDGFSADHPLQTTYQPTEQPKLSLLDRFKQQVEESKGGLASAPINAYLGGKQLVTGSLSPIEQDVLRQNKEAESKAPISSLLGNVAMVAAAPATSIPRVAAQGAAYMALQPTEQNGVEGYQQRAWEGTKAGVLGAGFGYLANKVGSSLANKFGERVSSITAPEIDDAINATLKDSGQTIHDLPNGYAQQLRDSVLESVSKGKKLDIPATLRQQEFKSVGITGTQGQITRDPMQYATEQNLRGVAGVGEPLKVAFTNQENQLRSTIGKYASGAKDRYQAGSEIGGALTKADEAMSSKVSELYKQARTSAGKDLELPLQGLAQDYATTLRDFGDKIPSGVRNNFEDLGLLTGKQNKLFTVEEADRLLKVINANSSNDPAVNTALKALRGSVKNTVLQTDASGGVYAPAVKAAAERFKMHDMLPALQQAARGEIDADKFVAKHIVGANPESVINLTKMLKLASPDAYEQSRAQVGEYLRKSAYGLDSSLTAGDSAFRPAGFAKALDSLGERLKAFYTPDEITTLKQLSRVGSYMNTSPAKAAVSSSNSAVPIQNTLLAVLGTKFPYSDKVVNLAKGATTGARNNSAVKNALSEKLITENQPLLQGIEKKYQNNLMKFSMPLSIGLAQ
jgi:hypothetical protein